MRGSANCSAMDPIQRGKSFRQGFWGFETSYEDRDFFAYGRIRNVRTAISSLRLPIKSARTVPNNPSWLPEDLLVIREAKLQMSSYAPTENRVLARMAKPGPSQTWPVRWQLLASTSNSQLVNSSSVSLLGSLGRQIGRIENHPFAKNFSHLVTGQLI